MQSNSAVSQADVVSQGLLSLKPRQAEYLNMTGMHDVLIIGLHVIDQLQSIAYGDKPLSHVMTVIQYLEKNKNMFQPCSSLRVIIDSYYAIYCAQMDNNIADGPISYEQYAHLEEYKSFLALRKTTVKSEKIDLCEKIAKYNLQYDECRWLS